MPNVAPELLRVEANGLEHQVLEWLPDANASSTQPTRNMAARTVVLVHGFGDVGATWDLVVPFLTAAGLRVLAPDMRGFGDGVRAPAGGYYHFVDYVFDLADIVDELVPEETFALVGHSMGGSITTLLAGTFPERVARFVNIEGLGPPDNPFELGPTRMRSWIEQVRNHRARGDRRATFTREEALLRLAGNHPSVPVDVLAHRLPFLVTEAENGRVAWHLDGLHRTQAPTPFFVKLYIEFAKQVTAPVLFVSGGARGFHPPDEEERLAAFANLTRAELPEAGHMIHWTQPERLASLMLDHFREA